MHAILTILQVIQVLQVLNNPKMKIWLKCDVNLRNFGAIAIVLKYLLTESTMKAQHMFFFQLG